MSVLNITGFHVTALAIYKHYYKQVQVLGLGILFCKTHLIFDVYMLT